MKDFAQLYLEHQNKIDSQLEHIKHVDLWSEQVSFLMDEHPFKAPAIFIAYRSLATKDGSNKSQSLKLGVDIYYYYETFADTRKGSKTQNKALNFLNTLTQIHQVFHGTSGQYYSEMRRVGFAPVETGTANLLYVVKFECMVSDDSAMAFGEDTNVNEVEIVKEKAPTWEDYNEIEIQKK